MTFGTQDEQTAGGTHCVRLRGDLLPVLGVQLLILPAHAQNRLVFRVGTAGCHRDQTFIHTGGAQVCLGHVLRVSAQHDIGSASRHIG